MNKISQNKPRNTRTLWSNKQASIGSTITGIVATFVIFFMMIGFIFLTTSINKLRGSEKFNLDSLVTYGQTPSGINSFISYLNFPQADGKSPLEKVKDEDFSSLEKDFTDNPEQAKKLINSECYLLMIFENGGGKFSTGHLGVDSTVNYDIAINQWDYIYLTSNSGSVITIKYYGGSCIK